MTTETTSPVAPVHAIVPLPRPYFQRDGITIFHGNCGPEDFEWLVYAGIITEEREMVFYVIDDAMFRMSYDFAPIMPDRRVIFSTVS